MNQESEIKMVAGDIVFQSKGRSVHHIYNRSLHISCHSKVLKDGLNAWLIEEPVKVLHVIKEDDNGYYIIYQRTDNGNS